MSERPAPAVDLPAPRDPHWYLNRELSWLDFNDRVFAEAADERNPLLERVKFLAITASNLDEFYSKRIGWLKRGIDADPSVRTVDGLTLAEQLDAVRLRGAGARRAMDACWRDILAPLLAERGVTIVSFGSLDRPARDALRDYFARDIYPVLTPLVVDPAHPFPFISGGSLSLALELGGPAGLGRFGRVKVPENRPRFIDAGDQRFVLLEDLIAAHLALLFPGAAVSDVRAMRVLRSADILGPGEEADDLREVVESELRRRRLAEAVALELSGPLSPARTELLLEELELQSEDTLILRSPLRLADLFQISDLPLPDASFAPFTPAVPSAFSRTADDATFFSTLQERDILVHHPFESFDATVARFVEEAAQDPQVLAIKQTLYRTSPDSPILQALIDAAGRGKQVAVIVELTARFDEANNIEWARRLEDAGVHIAYGTPDLKIHCKLSLVVREEAAGVRLYGHIGTGNYNSRTARVYTDLGLFTADPVICADLIRVFNRLTGFSDRLDTQELISAPDDLRLAFETKIQREIDAARAGRPARLIFKMNGLEDPAITQLLYDASSAGVQVDLIIRGICRLRPAVETVSDHVRVVSIIGRFLEHSRVYYFANDGDPEYFIGSADIMKRNLDERIEVLVPVRRPALQTMIHELLERCLADRRQAWRLHDDAWTRDPAADAPGLHADLLARAPFS